jgi:hypothetical protein
LGPAQSVLAPQKVALVFGSMQLPSQLIWPLLHTTWHAPSTQLAGEVHVAPALSPVQSPEAPQLLEFVSGLTHELPQLTCSALQLATHSPSLHTKPASHALPHSPQFSASLSVSTHASVHHTSLPVQVLAHSPLPSQANPLPHSVPGGSWLGRQWLSSVAHTPGPAQRSAVNAAG